MRIRGSTITMLLVMLFIAACSGCADRTSAPPPAETVAESVERGPVRLEATFTPGEVEVGARTRLSIEVVAAPGVAITMPVFDDPLGPFDIVSRRTPPDVADETGARVWRHEYDLTTFETGEVTLPEWSVSFVDERDEAAIEGAIEGPALTLVVASLIGANVDPAEYRDITGELDIPIARRWLWALLATLVLTLALLTVAGIWLVRRGMVPGAPAAAPPPPAAHLWANAELDRLESEGLVEAGAFEPFYVRVSGIVREYVERRFGLMAPERTTDEFLREAQSDRRLSGDHQDSLRTFLVAADLVKFAQFEPSSDDGHAAMATARQFVAETTPAERAGDAA